MLLPRKRLSDITNLSIRENGNVPVSDDSKFGKNGSPIMVNEYITKLLKENNTLMRALAERNTEVQNLRLMVAKTNQQNWQLAQTHSQMLAELNLGKDRVKAAQHELGCTSAALKVKAQELEELKKLNSQGKRIQNKESQQIENVLPDASPQLRPSHKKICLPNRKHPMRSRSLGPLSVANQATAEETQENRRKPLRRGSAYLKAGSCVPGGELFEIEGAELPKGEEWKDEAGSLPSPTIQIKVEQEDHFPSGLMNRTSLGRPLRRAAVKVNSYKEMPLKLKLRRPE